MGIFDTVKGWFNVDGGRVAITRCDDPFPETSAIHRGGFVLSARRPCRVLGFSVALRAEWDGDDAEDPGGRVECGVAACTGEFDIGRSFPVELRPGEDVDMGWCMVDVDIPDALRESGAPSDPARIKYSIAIAADVEGAALEPTATREITVIAG